MLSPKFLFSCVENPLNQESSQMEMRLHTDMKCCVHRTRSACVAPSLAGARALRQRQRTPPRESSLVTLQGHQAHVSSLYSALSKTLKPSFSSIDHGTVGLIYYHFSTCTFFPSRQRSKQIVMRRSFMPSLQTSGGVNAHANVLRSDEMRYATAVPQYAQMRYATAVPATTILNS